MSFLWIYFLIVSMLCGVLFLLRDKQLQHAMFIPFLGIQTYFCWYVVQHMDLISEYYFRVDTISGIFVSVITILSFPTILHSYLFARRRKETWKLVAIHNASMMALIAFMCGVLITGHLALLWAFLEATTMACAMLIYRDRSKMILEAAWKYFFVCSIGIALAYVGIMFLAIAGKEVGDADLTMNILMRDVANMNPLWLKLAFIFIISGFSVKVGVAPLFTVDIDAKDAAPTHVGALFSGGMTIAGFVAVFRFYEIFSHSSIFEWMNSIILFVGILSVFFATAYTIRISNFKRLLAYSSVEHAGIIMIALSAGKYGYFAAIIHLICHAFIKASLFFQLGQVFRIYKSESYSHLGNYISADLFGGLVLLTSYILIVAVPPSGLGISEFLIFKSLFHNKQWWVLAVLAVLLAFMFANLGRRFASLIFLPAAEPRTMLRRRTIIETVPQVFLIGLVIWIGINPPAEFVSLVERAVFHLPR
jgi:hydrogenase-4 component F